MRYFVEVVPPGEPGIRHEVSAGSGTLGTGVEDVVRLSGGSIVGPGALRLSVSASGIEVAARDSACKFTYQGITCGHAHIGWGEEIYLSGTRLSFVAQAGEKRRASPVLFVVVFFALLFVIGGLLRLIDSELMRGASPEPPVLFSGEVPCRASSAEAARLRAEEARALGLAKEERYPFSRKDGVRALRLLEEASSCFEKASLPAERKQVRTQLDAWSHAIERDFRDLRLRLDLALRAQRTEDALDAARALESMLSAASEEPEDDYSRWLSLTKSQLQARAPQKK